MKKRLITILMVLLLLPGGCTPTADQDGDISSSKADTGIVFISLASIRYAEKNKRLPHTLEELQEFCSDPNMIAAPVEWDNFTWREIEPNSVILRSKTSGISVPIRFGQGIPPEVLDRIIGDEQGIHRENLECLFLNEINTRGR